MYTNTIQLYLILQGVVLFFILKFMYWIVILFGKMDPTALEIDWPSFLASATAMIMMLCIGVCRVQDIPYPQGAAVQCMWIGILLAVVTTMFDHYLAFLGVVNGILLCYTITKWKPPAHWLQPPSRGTNTEQ